MTNKWEITPNNRLFDLAHNTLNKQNIRNHLILKN